MRRRGQKRLSDSGSGDERLFLSNPPQEIGTLLNWFHAGAKPEECSREVEDYACGFLGALTEVQAFIPRMNVQPAKLLAWVLTHHLRNPSHCAAWLNLGWSLRIIAASDPKPLVPTRLQKALRCFDRSLALGKTERAVVIRAWAGKAFTNAQLSRFEEAVRCSSKALELDRADPDLWLLHSSMLEMAGRKEEALEVIDEAYKAYVTAGRPEGLRYLFDEVVPPVNTPDPEKHLRRTQ
jgi:tetratricopeptide (TPR) repeat protein